MSISDTLTVALADRSYPIYIGENLLSNAALLQKHISSRQVMIVSNTTVGALYLPAVKQACKDKVVDEIVLPDGEQYKNLEHLSRIFDALITKKHHRNTTLVALGGGVICDMTGFAAACYQRGVGFIQIPTTLLAQVDASIGGKTAVNHPAGKNMIGAFYQPRCVIIDVSVLNTLPDREFNAGLAEVIKAAVIRDERFFDWLEQNIKNLLNRDKEALMQAIKKSCEIKANIVAADEKEITEERALLNFGHTFGHAIEQTAGYGALLHGEAVSIGMILESQLSEQLGMIDESLVQRLQHLLKRADLPIRLPLDLQYDKILNAMTMDKKAKYNNLRFVLLRALGKANIIDNIKRDNIVKILQEVRL